MDVLTGDNDDDFVIGCVLSLKTTLGDEIIGRIITFDRLSNLLVIQEGDSSSGDAVPKRNVRIIKANYIKEFNVLGRSEDPLDIGKCSVDLPAIRARERAALRQAESEAERLGAGVTVEAQSIFDALSKTLPVRWDKTVIVVMNEVRVCSPYFPENVSSGTPAANDRVKKVLENVRRRLLA